jgi:hypothetical protein
MTTKRKQVHLTKEQIVEEKARAAAQKEQDALAKVRKDFIDEKFMPMMEGITENIEEAQFLCETLKTVINQGWQNKAGEMKLSELKLLEHLKKTHKPELVWKHVKVLELLDAQSIRDAMILLDALFAEANRAVTKSITDKKLSDFKNNGDKRPIKSITEYTTEQRPANN